MTQRSVVGGLQRLAQMQQTALHNLEAQRENALLNLEAQREACEQLHARMNSTFRFMDTQLEEIGKGLADIALMVGVPAVEVALMVGVPAVEEALKFGVPAVEEAADGDQERGADPYAWERTRHGVPVSPPHIPMPSADQ